MTKPTQFRLTGLDLACLDALRVLIKAPTRTDALRYAVTMALKDMETRTAEGASQLAERWREDRG